MWKAVQELMEIILILTLASMIFKRGYFTIRLEYLTTIFILGLSAISANLLLYFEDPETSFTLTYISSLGLITGAIAYMEIKATMNPIVMLLFLVGVLILIAQHERFNGLEYPENFWIVLMSYIGFWIIWNKFKELGTLDLILSINTALLIGFLSYELMKEETENL